MGSTLIITEEMAQVEPELFPIVMVCRAENMFLGNPRAAEKEIPLMVGKLIRKDSLRYFSQPNPFLLNDICFNKVDTKHLLHLILFQF